MRTADDCHEPSIDGAPAPSGDAPVRANTVEKNGEISMSIEETNRVRAALGLKPLSLGPAKKDASVVNLQKTSEDVEAERARTELARKLAQSKKKRALTQKLAGQSIGEQLQASASSSALDWVKQTRARVDAAAVESDQTASDATAPVYDASALAGMVVGHDAAAFDDGNEVVLTLKDTRVLADDGNDLNDAADELVNVAMSERDRRDAATQRAARAVMPAYSGVDDDEFLIVGGRSKKPRAPRLLAQYDDESDRQARAEAQKFTLDASGQSAVRSDDRRDAVDDSDDVAVVSLAMDKTKRMDEYFTPEELAAQFGKRKTKKLRKKQRAKAPVDDAAAEDGDAATLMQQLEAEALKQQQGSRDRGRRRRRVADDDDDDLDNTQSSGVDDASLLRFQEARERANATASSALSAMKRKRRAAAAADTADDTADDAVALELSASLARTRRLAQLQEHEATTAAVATPLSSTKSSVVTSEDRIAALVSQTVGLASGDEGIASTNSNAKAVGHVFGATPLEAQSHSVVFNDATDFETRLKNAMEQRNAQFQAAATLDAAAALGLSTSAAVSAPATVRAVVDSGDEEMKGGDEATTSGKVDATEDEETKESEVWGEEQPLVGSGMAATLALLRKTGDLRETRTERQAGRANDARDRNVDEELRIKDGVKLDYRDEFGRLLTKKEAFRMLSYKFHGQEPGKKKKEKRLKQLKEELEAQKLLSGEGSTTMMKVLEKKQKHAKQAHVVLSGGV